MLDAARRPRELLCTLAMAATTRSPRLILLLATPQVRIVGFGDRLDLVDLARRQHQRLGAVVLDATAQVLDGG